MHLIRIYHIESSGPRPTTTVAQRKEMRRRIAAMSRVDRDAVVDFFTPQGKGTSDFYKLPCLPRAAVKDASARRYYHGDEGWTVPAPSLGRYGLDSLTHGATQARSTAESLRLWIAKHLSDVVNPAHVAVVVDEA
jgi:hypothetical protein